MSEQAQEWQQWTPENICEACGFTDFYSGIGELIKKICDVHNATIAAEQQTISNAFSKGYDQGYSDAIAAERAKVKRLTEALRQIGLVGHSTGGNTPEQKLFDIAARCDRELAALTKAKEGA